MASNHGARQYFDFLLSEFYHSLNRIAADCRAGVVFQAQSGIESYV